MARPNHRPRRPAPLCPALALALAVAACSSSAPSKEGTTVAFDLAADLTTQGAFYQLPWPSDLRLTSGGAPDIRGFPNPSGLRLIDGWKNVVGLHKGFSHVPVAWFQTSDDLAPRHPTDVIAADRTAPALLVDVDPRSPERGRLIPLVADTPTPDKYVPDAPLATVTPGRQVARLLALSPRPGFVLAAERTYAFVVMRAIGDATGAPLSASPAFAALNTTSAPSGERQAKAWALYQPLWATLGTLGVDPAQVAAATVFTTGARVEETFALSEKARPRFPITIDQLAVREGGNQARNCELVGRVTYPQFQNGVSPFPDGGVLQVGDDGTPLRQRDEVAPIGLSLPQTAMPAGGYPLVLYIHGSGGLSTQLFDRGAYTTPTTQTPHQGPAYVVAEHGFAMAGSAMPVNPERVPGASELAYINYNNLAAFPGTFVQGTIEARLFLDALAKLEIPPEAVKGCSGLALPRGASAFKLDLTHLIAQGQSMGAQYANLVAAVEPRVQAVAPSGSGGLWSYTVLTTHAIPGAKETVGYLIGSDEVLSWLHPALGLLQAAWEPADAIVYMPRVARRPLSGHPVRPVYEPVGENDEYFTIENYDAVAVAYGHKQAGEKVWPSMQPALALEGRDGLIGYPVSQDLMSEGGVPYTGAVIQYRGDGLVDAHYIFQQLDAVKYQYGCFMKSFLTKGVATIPAPAALGTPCP